MLGSIVAFPLTIVKYILKLCFFLVKMVLFSLLSIAQFIISRGIGSILGAIMIILSIGSKSMRHQLPFHHKKKKYNR